MSAPTAVPERTYQALSRIDAEGNALLNNATLVVGDGTQKVAFRNGRAQVPHHLAAMVAQHPDVEVYGFDPTVEVPAPAPAPIRTVTPDPEPSPENWPTPEPAAAAPAPEAPKPEAPAPEDLSDEVKAAMEHLAAEGEDVPTPDAPAAEVPTPNVDRSAFEATTPDGQARCQAAKGDGTQCSNPAQADSSSCGLPKHVEQLAPAAD